MDADLSLLAGNVSTSSALTSASRLSSCADFSTTTSAPSTSTAGRQHRAQTSSLATAIEDGKKENVFVCVRVRPSRAGTEQDIYDFDEHDGRVSLNPRHPTLTKRGGGAGASAVADDYDFRFDALHLSQARTADLYEPNIANIVERGMQGYNATIFAYGQTASGKTHTMLGNDAEPGVIPLAVDHLFRYITQQHSRRSYTLRVSFLEIYNETLRDLLAPATVQGRQGTKSTLDITGDDGHVRGLVAVPVSSAQEILQLVQDGERRRHVAGTDFNERSSRSHSVFQVTIESAPKERRERTHNPEALIDLDDESDDEEEDDCNEARTSKLNLIDLAGSESATGQDDRRKEGAYINRSLLTLGTVIAKLTEPPKAGAVQHVPYRDSKLTRLLQTALSGNSRVAVVCTISPDVAQATETLSTLKFAKRAKMVVTKAERGVLMSGDMMLKMYAKKVDELNGKIREIEDSDSVLRERDSAKAQAREAQSRIAAQDIELAALREQLAHTKSFILTGPVVRENARRASSNAFQLPPPLSRSELTPVPGSPASSPSRASLTRANERITQLERDLGLRDEEAAAEARRRREELASLRASLEQSQAECFATVERLAGTDARLGELTARLATADASAEAARGDTSRARDELEQLAEVMARQAEAHGDAERDLHNRIKELESGRTRGKERDADLDIANARIKELEGALASASSSTDSRVEQASSRIDGLSRELADAHAQLSRDRAEASERLAKAMERVASLESELAEASQGLRKADEELAASSERTAALEQNLAAASRRVARLEAEVAATAEALSDVESAKGTAEQQLAATKQESEVEMDELRGELKSLRAELDTTLEREQQAKQALQAREQVEAQRQAAIKAQRAGAEGIRNKIAAIQASKGQPLYPPRVTRASSNGSTVSSHDGMDTELQAKNDELQKRVKELEQQLRNSSKDGSPRLRLAERNSTRDSSAPSTPTKAFKHSVGLGSPYFVDQPPPLPQSPRNRDKERRHRRETLDKDLARLKESATVAQTRSRIDGSATRSPPRYSTRHSSRRLDSRIDENMSPQ